MNRRFLALVAALAIGAVGVSGADAAKADKKGGKKKADASAVIERISGSSPNLTLALAVGHGKRATKSTVNTSSKTSVTVDGQTKAVADLKVGQHVKVDHATGQVARIDASADDQPGKKNKKSKKQKA